MVEVLVPVDDEDEIGEGGNDVEEEDDAEPAEIPEDDVELLENSEVEVLEVDVTRVSLLVVAVEMLWSYRQRFRRGNVSPARLHCRCLRDWCSIPTA